MSEFSVLISVYDKEVAEYYNSCLLSITKQSLQPTEVVIIHDGVVRNALKQIERNYEKQLPLRIFDLSENVGLGKALSYGLDKCNYNIIMRVDSDDINDPDRFAKQINYMNSNPNIAVCSGVIAEFARDCSNITAYRSPPTLHDSIVAFSKYRNPINHMAACFRKSDVLKAGGYMKLDFFEDYFLWIRMLINGCKFANLPDVLVYARTGNGMLARRGGHQYAKNEYQLFLYMFKNKFLSFAGFLTVIITRLPIRYTPIFLRKLVYLNLRKT